MTSLRVAWAGLVALASTGCISIDGHFGSRIPTEHLSRIQVGETTREEITAWFGPPSAFYNPTVFDLIFDDPDELTAPERPILDDVFTWRYVENEARVFFVPILFALARGEATAETLIVFFDDAGRVEHYAFRRDAPAAEDD
jgi:outer membrane protein assembly factor BamE (lipoprotein component of BamABCDE complex)